MTRPTRLFATLAVATNLLLVGGAEARAQECPGGRISFIFVDNHSVFDTDEIRDGTRFRWAYELANSIHMTTDEAFIRDELVIREGDCYDPLLLEESERLLRAYTFVARVDVFGLQQPDGSWHVVVDTKDEWTTKLNLNVNLEEGVQFRGISATEENLLGQGHLLGLFFRQIDEEKDVGARFFTPRIFGTRLDVALEGGRTRTGEFFREELFYPFVGEVGRLGFRQVVALRDELFPYSVAGEPDFEHVLLPLDQRRLEVTVAGRLGRPGNLTILGLGFSHETMEFQAYPEGLEVTRDGFADRTAAPPGVAELVRSQTAHTGSTRLNLLFGQRNVRFVQRQGLDALRGIQDVEVGTDVALTVGRSIGAFPPGEDQPEDLYTRLRLFGGLAPDQVTVNFAASVEARRVFSGSEEVQGWRDVISELDALLYWQPSALPDHTLFARLEGAGGWNMTLPFQLTLGGPEGLRGYHRENHPGARRVVLSVEDRLYLAWPFPDLFDFGLTFFADAGRMWGGDVPFGRNSGWKASVGGGLRIGFPAGTRGVARVDIAWPFEPGAGFRDAVLRISLFDLTGLAGSFEDLQLLRSRRVRVGPDLIQQERPHG
ncbi:MAG: BamA/TamA family outer membrane protein [Gemmatimonadota bacterium]|jgi:hypothetical protein